MSIVVCRGGEPSRRDVDAFFGIWRGLGEFRGMGLRYGLGKGECIGVVAGVPLSLVDCPSESEDVGSRWLL
jgi:hypothetical protein